MTKTEILYKILKKMQKYAIYGNSIFDELDQLYSEIDNEWKINKLNNENNNIEYNKLKKLDNEYKKIVYKLENKITVLENQIYDLIKRKNKEIK